MATRREAMRLRIAEGMANAETVGRAVGVLIANAATDRDIGLPMPVLHCPTTQCRVETFVQAETTMGRKCPACYGAGS